MRPDIEIHREAIVLLISKQVSEDLKAESGTNLLDEKIETLTQRYQDVRHELYNPQYTKTESLWQMLNAVRLVLDMDMPIHEDTLKDIKECLKNNRP